MIQGLEAQALESLMSRQTVSAIHSITGIWSRTSDVLPDIGREQDGGTIIVIDGHYARHRVSFGLIA